MTAREELKEYSVNKVEKTPWKDFLTVRVTLKTIAIVIMIGISFILYFMT